MISLKNRKDNIPDMGQNKGSFFVSADGPTGRMPGMPLTRHGKGWVRNLRVCGDELSHVCREMKESNSWGITCGSVKARHQGPTSCKHTDPLEWGVLYPKRRHRPLSARHHKCTAIMLLCNAFFNKQGELTTMPPRDSERAREICLQVEHDDRRPDSKSLSHGVENTVKQKGRGN